MIDLVGKWVWFNNTAMLIIEVEYWAFWEPKPWTIRLQDTKGRIITVHEPFAAIILQGNAHTTERPR